MVVCIPRVYVVRKKGEKSSCPIRLDGVELIKFARTPRSRSDAAHRNIAEGLRIPKGSVNYLPPTIVSRFSCAARSWESLYNRRAEWMNRKRFEPVGETDLRGNYTGFPGFYADGRSTLVNVVGSLVDTLFSCRSACQNDKRILICWSHLLSTNVCDRGMKSFFLEASKSTSRSYWKIKADCRCIVCS